MEDKIVRFDLAEKIFKEMPEKCKMVVGNAQVEICFIGGLNIIVRVFYFDGKHTKKRSYAFGNNKEHIELVLNSFDTKLSQIEKELIGYEKDQSSLYEIDGFTISSEALQEVEINKEITPSEGAIEEYINQLPTVEDCCGK